MPHHVDYRRLYEFRCLCLSTQLYVFDPINFFSKWIVEYDIHGLDENKWYNDLSVRNILLLESNIENMMNVFLLVLYWHEFTIHNAFFSILVMFCHIVLPQFKFLYDAVKYLKTSESCKIQTSINTLIGC